MLLKNKLMVGLAALALAGGTTMLAMPAANAATMKCGVGCATLASEKYGASDVVAVGSASAGELAAFWYNSGEDFLGQPEGSVRAFSKAGVVSGSLAKTYGSDQLYQYVYAPDGHVTDECLGASVGSTAVTLQSCGHSSNTLWVVLSGWAHGNFEPVLSAVLSAQSAMLLTASAANGALTVTQMNLSSTTSNGVTTSAVASNQMWETVCGVYGNSTVSNIFG